VLVVVAIEPIGHVVDVPLLAVSSQGGGVVVHARMMLGGDVVRVEPEGLVGEDTELSLKLAVALTSLLTGGVTGVRVVFSDGEVSGASAGAVFAAVMLLAVRGLWPPKGVTGTGMLSPLGLVLPVKGVEAKLEAAARANMSRVFIPFASAEQPVETGMEVVRVCTVFEAALAMASRTPPSWSLELTSHVREVEELFRDEALMLIELARKLGLNVTRALKAYQEGRYYAAASIAFSLLTSRAEDALPLVLEALNATSVEQVLDMAARRLYSVVSKLKQQEWVKVNDVLAVVEAASRLYVAENLALNASGRGLAALRALTVLSWLDLVGSLPSPQVPLSTVRDVAKQLVAYARLSLDYVKAVAGSVAASLAMEDGRSLESWLDDAHYYYVSGNYFKALGLAVRAIARLDAALALASMGSSADRCYRSLVAEYLAQLATYGVATPSALLYHTYALTLPSPHSIPLEASAASRLLLALAVTAKTGATAVEAKVAREEIVLPYTILSAVITASVASALAAIAFTARRKEVEYGLRL
jgi:predicted S18 family serine protease